MHNWCPFYTLRYSCLIVFLYFNMTLMTSCKKENINPSPDELSPEVNNGFWDVTEDVTVFFDNTFHSTAAFRAQTIGLDISTFEAVQKRNTLIYPWAGFTADTILFEKLDGNVLYNKYQGKIGKYSDNFDTLDYTYAYGLGVVYSVKQHWIRNKHLTYDSVYPKPPSFDHPFFNDSVKSILLPSYGSISNIGDTGTLIWKASNGDFPTAPFPLYDGENAYVSTNATMVSVNYNTGSTNWYEVNGSISGFSKEIAYYNNKIFATSYSVNSYDAKSGGLLNSISLESFALTGPYIKDSTIYVGDGSYSIYSINAITNHTNWKYKYWPTGGFFFLKTLPVVSDGVLFFVLENGTVMALDATTGTFKWLSKLGVTTYSNPVVKNGYLYIGCDDGNMYALDISTGYQKWKFTSSYKIRSTVFIYKNNVYFGSGDSKVYSLNALTGKVNWTFPTGSGMLGCSPSVVNDVLYIGSGGNLYAIDCRSGKQIWKFATNDLETSSPCVITISNIPVSAYTER